MPIARNTPAGTQVRHSVSGFGLTASAVHGDGTVDVSYDNGRVGMDVSARDSKATLLRMQSTS